jgi:hypothetical protein
MLCTGIDYHKRHSVVCTRDAEERRVQSARIDWNEPAVFAAYFQRLPAPSRTVEGEKIDLGWTGGRCGSTATPGQPHRHPVSHRLPQAD